MDEPHASNQPEVAVTAAAEPAEATASSVAPAPAPQQIVDIVRQPPAETPVQATDDTAPTDAAQTPAPAPVSAADMPAAVALPAKKPARSQDTTIAIVATVVIVVALAVLATFTFLNQK